jgi:hypothetical protein
MRSAAQVISYEIPAGVAIFVPVLMAGTLSMQGIIQAQGGLPWEWFIFRNPAAFVAFFILFTSQLAEANRTPFDLPEAESELVAGYLSEFSGFRFALLMMAEYGNLWVLSAVSTTLFLGGWQIPGVGLAAYDAARGSGVLRRRRGGGCRRRRWACSSSRRCSSSRSSSRSAGRCRASASTRSWRSRGSTSCPPRSRASCSRCCGRWP